MAMQKRRNPACGFVLSLTLLLLGFGGSVCPAADESILIAQQSPPAPIEKAFICFRLGFMPEEQYQDLLVMFDKYKGVTDELTFFIGLGHSLSPLDKIQPQIDTLAKRMELARQHGYRAGLNNLCTIGHHSENLEHALKGDYTFVTDIDGRVCEGSFCPNNENHRKHVRKLYTAIAKANPDYIWIDDDVRLAGHMPVYLTCFCDTCLAIFEKETGQKFTRETLKKAANTGSLEEKIKVRKAWLQHNRNTIGNLFSVIEQTVHQISPAMPLGFMTGDRFAEGYDFDTWAGILAGPSRVDVRWRPGGGFYEDSKPGELAGKSHDIGRQVSVLPPTVLNIQSEIENFPYHKLRKAEQIVVLEAASHIAAGCTGAAFNVLSGEPIAEAESLIARLQQARPFFDLMARTLGRRPIVGAAMFWNKDSYAAEALSEEWFGSTNPFPRHELYEIGLPTGYSADLASVVMLHGDSVYALSKDRIQSLLSRAVYMDVQTLQHLNAMGFGDLTGFEPVHSEEADRIECFTDHPLNGIYANRRRNCYQSFWKSTAWSIRKTNEKAQILANLIDYSEKPIADCTLGIFENRLGGRIAVAGYSPWTFMQSLAKTAQMKSLFRWLSKDTLPGYIASCHTINLWIRQPQDGQIALAFTNSSFDPAENLILMLRTNNKTLILYDMQCNPVTVQAAESDGPYRKFLLPRVEPWQIRLAVCAP